MIKFEIKEECKDFSGHKHQLVCREDGFKFFLDELFLEALIHSDDPDIDKRLIEMGAAPEEIKDIFSMLIHAGLIKGDG